MSEKSNLPPGQRVTNKWAVLHIGEVPKFDRATWDFTTSGLVDNSLKLTYDEFISLPSIIVIADFHCVTAWSKLDNKWEGVLFRTIANFTKIKPQAKFVSIICDGGYNTNLPLEVVMDDDVLFAYKNNGELIPAEHGYPLRLIVPKRYGWKSAKWVRKVEFLSDDRPGFWETRGYNNNGDPWKEERYSVD